MYLYGWIPSLTVHLKPTQYCLLISYTPTENKKLKKDKETSRHVCVCVCVCVYLCHPELYPFHTDIFCLHIKDERIFSTSTKKYVFSLSFLERDRPLSLAFVFLLFNRDIRKGNILLSSFFSDKQQCKCDDKRKLIWGDCFNMGRPFGRAGLMQCGGCVPQRKRAALTGRSSQSGPSIAGFSEFSKRS